MTTHHPDYYCRPCLDTGKDLSGMPNPQLAREPDWQAYLEAAEPCEDCPCCEMCDERIGGLKLADDSVWTTSGRAWCNVECLEEWSAETLGNKNALEALLSAVSWAMSEHGLSLDCERGDKAKVADILGEHLVVYAEHLRLQMSNGKGVVL